MSKINCNEELEWMRREIVEWRDTLCKQMACSRMPTDAQAKSFQALRDVIQDYLSRRIAL